MGRLKKPPESLEGSTDILRLANELLKQEAELDSIMGARSFREFISLAWEQVETSDFIHDWYIDVIADHLEAVARFEVKQLVICIPPRHTKSLLVSVFFPSWVWVQDPKLKFVFSSYAHSLSLRDALRTRRLIESKWFQDRWPDVKVTKDQNRVEKYELTKGGHRFSTSVGGQLTGEGGDFAICFPYHEEVWTNQGKMPIGRIVEEKLEVLVYSVNLFNGSIELKPIENWIKNKGSQFVEVHFDDGSSIECTPDHKFWTTNGWVEAQNLIPSDMLPILPRFDELNGSSAYIEHFGQFPLRKSGLENLKYLLLSQFSEMMVFANSFIRFLSDTLCNRIPCSALADLGNGNRGNTVFFTKFFRGFFTFYNLNDLFSGKFRSRPFLKKGESAMPFGIGNILRSSAIGKIFKNIIHGISIQMPYFLSSFGFSHKSKQNGLMYPYLDSFTSFPCIESGVFLTKALKILFPRSLKNPPRNSKVSSFAFDNPSNTFNSPHIGNKIQSFKSRYVHPMFIRVSSHIGNSYCLTVKDNHNMVVGKGKGHIVANCDDGHNVKEAESDIVRKGTVTWWKEAMSSRMNNLARSSKVIIQQRVHQGDLAGEMIEEGYQSLILPMEYEPDHPQKSIHDMRVIPGELLSKRFTEQSIAELKISLGEYAYAGQYQQRPAPRGGGQFKDNFKTIKKEHLPKKFDKIINGWDFAASESNTSDWTVRVKMGKVKDKAFGDLFYIIHVKRFRASGGKLRSEIKSIVEADGDEIQNDFPIDPAAAGKEWATTLRMDLMGYPLVFSPERGDKVLRSQSYASIVELGNVYIVEDDWNKDFVTEHINFPATTYDDQVDAAGRAFRRLIFGRKLHVPKPANDSIKINSIDPTKKTGYSGIEKGSIQDVVREGRKRSRYSPRWHGE